TAKAQVAAGRRTVVARCAAEQAATHWASAMSPWPEARRQPRSHSASSTQDVFARQAPTSGPQRCAAQVKHSSIPPPASGGTVVPPSSAGPASCAATPPSSPAPIPESSSAPMPESLAPMTPSFGSTPLSLAPTPPSASRGGIPTTPPSSPSSAATEASGPGALHPHTASITVNATYDRGRFELGIVGPFRRRGELGPEALHAELTVFGSAPGSRNNELSLLVVSGRVAV